MKKLSTFLLALVAGAGTMFASDTSVDGIWYNFDDEHLTAEVTFRGAAYNSYSDEYSGEVVIPSSVTYNAKTYTVTSIGEYAFGWCSGLTSVTIPNSVTSIGWSAFAYCSGLTSVTIPNNSVTSIENFAFLQCTGLTSVTIPNSVTSIGGSVFYDCTGLTSVTNYATTPQSINSNVFENVGKSTCVLNVPKESVNLYQAADVWKEFTNIVGVDVPASGTSVDGIWYNFIYGNLTAEVTYQGDKYNSYLDEYSGEVVIPSSVTYNAKMYTVTGIGDKAFGFCSGLTSVTIPNSVTSIGWGAFFDCTGLTSVTIPNSVTSIGEGAFGTCTGLTSVTIPNSVTSIGDQAFGLCSGLTSVTNYATTPQSINSNVFDEVNKSTCVLNVPKESVSLYQAANVWKEFTNKTVEGDYTINYVDKDSQDLYNHVVTLYVPVAPTITGFTFLRWEPVVADIADGITLQAVYQAEESSSAPEVYTNPANPAQKLIKNGNVYILTDDKTYTITGQQVK